MGYVALYRKYRPINFDEIYGQDKNIKTLKNAIINDKISHAYLFCGSRGTGKTTTAKVIAKTVNCLNSKNGVPCNECDNCLLINNGFCDDIVEIDAASNNGVDEIREIRDKVMLVPSKLKFKVYIIDEVHMLTIGAFNALLKTLEEPPSHVIFILATTEAYKVPITISSRCQKLIFEKISNKVIVDKLKDIASKEKINVDNEILFAIARNADGALRDAINLFDQLITYSNSNITFDDYYALTGLVDRNEILLLLENVIMGNYKDIISLTSHFISSGKNILKLIEDIMEVTKDILVDLVSNNDVLAKYSLKCELNKDILLKIIDNLNKLLFDMKLASNSNLLFEAGMIDLAILINKQDNNQNLFSNDEKVGKNKKIILEKSVTKDAVVETMVSKDDVDTTITLNNDDKNINLIDVVNDKIPVDKIVNNVFSLATKNDLANIKAKWTNIADYVVDKKYALVAGLLLDCSVMASSNSLAIVVPHIDSSVDRINECYFQIVDFFKEKLEMDFALVAVDKSKWEILKRDYVKKTKMGIKYEYVAFDIPREDKKVVNSEISQLIDVLGDDIIEYK